MMTAPTRPPLVESYLDRLLEVSGALPTSRRRELLEEVAAHLDDLVASTRGNEAALRTAMERFGTPEDIVRAEGAVPVAAVSAGTTVPLGTTSPAATAGPGRDTSPWGVLEIAAVALLVAGITLLPVIGTLSALVCLWFSRQWGQTTKLGVTVLATAPVVLLMVLTPLLRFVLGAQGLWDRGYPGLPGLGGNLLAAGGLGSMFLVHAVATVIAAVWLVASLTRRTEQNAPTRV